VRPARLVCSFVLVTWAARVSPVGAQAAIEQGRFEVAIGPSWTGHARFGPRDANETTGAGTPFRLFASSTELAAATGFEGRVGVRLTRRLQVEASGSYGTPRLVARITNDVETSTAVTATERIQQFTVEGAVLWHVPVRRLGTRTIPFVTAGAGYLRQLHDRAVLIDAGQVYGVGGGVKHLLLVRNRAVLKSVGARVDVRAVTRTKGVATDSRAHISPALAGSVFLRF
jgi:hypothetical protein